MANIINVDDIIRIQSSVFNRDYNNITLKFKKVGVNIPDKLMIRVYKLNIDSPYETLYHDINTPLTIRYNGNNIESLRMIVIRISPTNYITKIFGLDGVILDTVELQ